MMSEKTLVRVIILLAVVACLLQILWKKPVDGTEVTKLKNQFSFRDRYIGNYAPDFDITCLDGSTFKLSDQLGTNTIVLNFFTTWCGPCKSEMPELQYFVDKTTNMPVQFLAIDVDESSGTAASFAKSEKLRFRIAADKEGLLAARYRVQAYPTTIVISPHGRVRLYEQGAIANADVTLMPLVSQLSKMIEHTRGGVNLQDYHGNAPNTLMSLREKMTNDMIQTESTTNVMIELESEAINE